VGCLDPAASTFELPAPDAADPAADYRLRFKECAYDGDADATTCTWQLTDAFGSISAPGGVSHVALDTCLGPDATPTPVGDEDDEPVEVTNVSPTTVVPPTSAPGPGPSPGPPPVTRVVSGTLPFTGSPAAILLKAALWLLGIGALLVFGVRRRRQATA
jgi:hypothetical protein